MRTSEPVTSRDTTLFASATARLGRFVCPLGAPELTVDQQARVPYLSFPLSSWRVQRSRSVSYLADPGVVTLWSGSEPFRRLPVSPRGVACGWLHLPSDLAFERVGELFERIGDRPFAAVPPQLALRFRRLLRQVEDAAAEPGLATLAVEEEAISIASDAFAALTGEGAASRSNRSHRDLAERVRLLLAEDLEADLNLGALGARLHISVFHLCRVFRREVGVSIHAYRQRLRLQEALDRLSGSPVDLTTLAFELGFASHSHFTTAFRKHFGLAPSSWAAASRVKRGRLETVRRISAA